MYDITLNIKYQTLFIWLSLPDSLMLIYKMIKKEILQVSDILLLIHCGATLIDVMILGV